MPDIDQKIISEAELSAFLSQSSPASDSMTKSVSRSGDVAGSGPGLDSGSGSVSGSGSGSRTETGTKPGGESKTETESGSRPGSGFATGSGPLSDMGVAASALLLQQQKAWPLLTGNYEGLKDVRVKELHFDGFKVKVQFNPGRIVSSSAKVDAKSISERKCFLCHGNLPEEQMGIRFNNDYIILGNPFPIFPEHLTIPHLEHIPQAIPGAFGDMLDLTRAIGSRFSVFYNGPKCGASAPDHLHFQAGNRGFLTIEGDLADVVTRYGSPLPTDEAVSVQAVDDTLRRYFVVRTPSRDQALMFFDKLYRVFDDISSSGEEPMMNIVAWYDEPVWTILLFLREKHRPSHYFREDEGNILLSPASVDFGGVCITPLEKDFDKMKEEYIREIFGEVSLGVAKFREIVASCS